MATALNGQLAAHAAEVLRKLDGGEVLANTFADALRESDPRAVLVTDEGLAVVYAPDARHPGEPYVQVDVGLDPADALRFSREWLGTLRIVGEPADQETV
jgi:hypothetical protein